MEKNDALKLKVRLTLETSKNLERSMISEMKTTNDPYLREMLFIYVQMIGSIIEDLDYVLRELLTDSANELPDKNGDSQGPGEGGSDADSHRFRLRSWGNLEKALGVILWIAYKVGFLSLIDKD